MMGNSAPPPPRLLAWETTRACNLACRHCRAEAVPAPPAGELTFEEGRNLLAQLAAWPPGPSVILSGGEPLLRPDITDLAAYGASLGLRMLLSTNGSLLDAARAKALKRAGTARLSLSLDSPQESAHDDFRGTPGSFAGVVEAAAHLRAAGLPFQINSALAAANLDQAAELTDMAQSLGAVAHHVFILVPVGRAEGLETARPAEAYEAALRELGRREAGLKLEFRVTCAPQYRRLGRELGRPVPGRGCLAGQGFMFISSLGRAQGCGYLSPPAGDARRTPLREIYENSPLFLELRDRARYRGRCGACEYWPICGGCRARALAAGGDHLGPEPLCPYRPKALGAGDP